MGYLVDSNVLIDYIAERFTNNQLIKLDAIFDVALNVSIITYIETLGYNITTIEEKKLFQFFSASNIISLTDDIAKQTVLIRKVTKIKTPDAIIAATALIHNYSLITNNLRDFKNINNLTVINPYNL